MKLNLFLQKYFKKDLYLAFFAQVETEELIYKKGKNNKQKTFFSQSKNM